MTLENKIKLWEAVNAYTQACGGNTGGYHNIPAREKAVVSVEKVVDDIILDAITATINTIAREA